jgi:excisionase family DNA binding protein
MKVIDVPSHDDVFTINDLMDILKVTRRTLLKYIKDGKLKAFKLGNEWRITNKQLEEFIEKNTVNN